MLPQVPASLLVFIKTSECSPGRHNQRFRTQFLVRLYDGSDDGSSRVIFGRISVFCPQIGFEVDPKLYQLRLRQMSVP